jgi:type IV pilus assembly protein PilE
MRQNPTGFTLIELMITVALLAIITMISVTSYRQYMLRANRTDASAILLRIAAAQEKWYLNNNQYSDDPVADLRIGATSERGYYSVTIIRNADPAIGYTAIATPADGSRQSTDTDCQQLSINETGQRASTPAGIDVCWH